MTTAYNEIDPFAAAWLRRLVDDGHIARGAVDERPIEEISPADVAGRGQRHFFAGIGGWSYALRLAGVADDADIWTGSCPCQPFSPAGRRGGVDDPRHLWPAWFALIRECRPATIFGEQVAGPDGLAWLDAVFADLEGCGYACGAAVISAGGVSAPHGRHRLYFVAYADVQRCEGLGVQLRERRSQQAVPEARGCSTHGNGGMGDADGLAGRRQRGAVSCVQGSDAGMRRSADGSGAPGRNLRAWDDAEWIPCRDPGRGLVYRPIEPGAHPLAHGVPARVGRLRGYGNAIVPQAAAAFITAALGAMP